MGTSGNGSGVASAPDTECDKAAATADRFPERPTNGRVDNLPPAVRTVLTGIAIGGDLSPRAIAVAFEATIELLPPIRDVVLGSLMTAVMARGPVAADVVALLRSALVVDMRGAAKEISGGERPIMTLAGSGKKGLRTLNISTPAALVAAAAGAQVIKVGSAATSSALGSRDLVRALGLPERRTAEDVRAGLDACGFAFVAVEPEIPILDRIYGGRFHVPNPFSFGLAPLASPVRGDITVFGLSHPRVEVAAEVLRQFGMTRVDVLTTRLPNGHYLDEIGSAGEVRWCHVRNGQLGPVRTQPARELIGATTLTELPTPCSADDAIERTGDLLAGRGLDSHRVLVSLNAAYLLVLCGIAPSLGEGVNLADDILSSGAALMNVSGSGLAPRSA